MVTRPSDPPCHPATGRPARRRLAGRSVALLVGGVALLGCPPTPPPLPPAPPPAPGTVAALAILPATLQVEAGSSFELESRATDAAGLVVVPDAAQPVTWTAPPGSGLTVTSAIGHRAWLSTSPSGFGPVTLQAVMAGITATATVDIHRGPPSSDLDTDPTDWLVAPQPAGAAPARVLVRGDRGGVPVHDEFRAFAGSVPLGAMTDRGTLAVFRQDQPARLVEVPWTPASERTTLPQGSPLGMPVRFWDATTSGVGAGFAGLAFSNDMLRRNLTGLRLDGELVLASAAVAIGDPEIDCTPARLALLFPAEYDPAQAELHLIVVEEIQGGAYAGYACLEPDGSPVAARVVFLARTHNPSTLAHEIGHQLALLEPASGHTNCAAGFGADNLMWLHWSDASAAAHRQRLSTGQLHRVTMDARSWAVRTGLGADPAKPSCQAAGANCPLLRLPEPEPPGWTPPAWCPP